MSEMVERVAKALMDFPQEEKLSDYYGMARAAIEAMHQYSAEMERDAKDAGRRIDSLFSHCDGNERGTHQWNTDTRRCTYCDKPMEPQ